MNNKAYIGETMRGEFRWARHLQHLRINKHPNSEIQQDFNEYGEEAFEWSIIKTLPKDREILMREETSLGNIRQDNIIQDKAK